jgi:23S rRNA (cytidine1920-2'-O)/16S rRNA (cytidine1409-2'-O)-methyltransferase
MTRERLDKVLEARGLAQSRARARDAILRGTVAVNGVVATKPHQPVSESDTIAINDPTSGYVSRSALKLIAGLDAGAIAVKDKVCLDVGSSTGGFTQVLAERGARLIHAVDVGQDQLHERVRALAQVVVHESQNARDLDRDLIPEPIDILTCDVSFVSVTKVLAAPLSLCAERADAVILIKPQFEAGLEHVGRGGIVSDDAAIGAAVGGVLAFMAEAGWRHRLALPSPISGGDGNREIVAVFERGSV